MKVAAAHCNPKKAPALSHNDRTDCRSHTINQEKTHLNECTATADEVRENINKLYEQASKNFYKYCENKNGISKRSGKPKGLQNFTKKEKCYHEFIFEISETTTLNQCQELSEKIAELTGFTPLQIALHRDETHKDASGAEKTHYHAHAVFFTLDSNGLQLARQEASLNKANLSKIQTLASEVFQMQRGKNRFEKGEKQPNYLQDYKEYARYKEQEKKLLQEIQEKEQSLHKLTEIAQKTQSELLNLQDTLKQKEAELELKEREYKQNLKELEQTHGEAFNKLLKESNAQKSLLKSLFTFGKYNERVEREYQIKKVALQATLNQAEAKVMEKIEFYKQQTTQMRERLKETQTELEKQRMITQEIKESAEKAKEWQRKYIQEAEKYKRFLKVNMKDEALKEYLPELYEEKQAEQRKNLGKEIERRFGFSR